VHLRVEIPGLPPEEARAVVDRADRVCPYSNAVRGNITVTHEVVTGAPGTD
jgi:organic hydroperoxide reductase OsmC/OhrA